MTASDGWGGRFPRNDIFSLLDVNRPLNLAESTTQDLTVGDVLDLLPPEEVRSLRLGYGSAAGLPALRSAIGAACGVPPDHVLTTQGTALGLFLLAFELCRPGGEAVLASPCFPPSRNGLIGCGAVVHDVRARFEEGYRLDVDRLAAAMSPRTRLVSVATPQNPSGVRLDEPTLRAILDAMARRAPEALLFVDETYREAVYGDAPTPHSVAALDPRIVVGASISKAHGAPGLRVGWLTVADAGLRERLTVAKMNTVICGSALDEALAAALLRHGEATMAPRRRLLGRLLDVVARWQANEAHRLAWVRPHGGALCCLRLRPQRFDDAAVARFWEVLPAHDLQLAPGPWFGEDVRVFRLGFGYLPEAQLGSALAALSRALDAATAAPGNVAPV